MWTLLALTLAESKHSFELIQSLKQPMFAIQSIGISGNASIIVGGSEGEVSIYKRNDSPYLLDQYEELQILEGLLGHTKVGLTSNGSTLALMGNNQVKLYAFSRNQYELKQTLLAYSPYFA